MSVVVAIKDNDKVWIGCDSQVTCGWSKNTLSNKNNYKIFRPEKDKDVIIGFVGDMRDRDILYCIDEWIDELTKLKNEVNYKYIIKTIVPKIFNILRDNKRLIEKTNEFPYMVDTLLFVYKNQVYKIHGDGCVIEIDDHCAIGSGDEKATGYLNECDMSDKKVALIKSIKSACKSDLYVNYPIIVMNSVSNEIEIIER